MSRYAGEVCIEFSSSQHAVDAGSDGTGTGQLHPDMSTQQIVGIINDTGLNHCIGAADAFLCRLEYHLYGTLQLLLQFREDFGYCQTDGGMTIMAAGMHTPVMDGGKALLQRLVSSIGGLPEIKGIHIEAQGNHRAVTGTLHGTYDTGEAAGHFFYPLRICSLRDSPLHFLCEAFIGRNAHHGFLLHYCGTGLHGIAQLRQLSGHHCGGAELSPARLGVFMQVTATGDHFIIHCIGGGKNLLHQGITLFHLYYSFYLL